MLTLLNGSQVNGVTLGSYWAWGNGVITLSPEVRLTDSVITAMGAESIANATSRGIPDRLAFLSSDQVPYATADIEATRYADFAGQLNSTATDFIEPVRLAYLLGSPEEGLAQSTGEPVRIRLVFNKVIPALARTWEDAGKTRKIRVNQQFASMTTTGRSNIRLLDSVWLGQGTAEGQAVATTDPLKHWFIRGGSGVLSGTSTSIVRPERTRQVSFAQVGTAYSVLAPTYKKAGGSISESWNQANSNAYSLAHSESSVLRYPTTSPLACAGSISVSAPFMIRGMGSVLIGRGSLETQARVNEWNFMVGSGYGLSHATEHTQVITQALLGELTVTGQASSNNRITSWFLNESLVGQASGKTQNTVFTDMAAEDAIANALIGSQSIASKGVLMTGSLSSDSTSLAEYLRVVTFIPMDVLADGSVVRLVYSINLNPGNRAPAYRSYIVPYRKRVYVIASENREVRI